MDLKNKIIATLALIFLVSVFLLPITALANVSAESEQTETTQTEAPPPSSTEAEQTESASQIPPTGTEQGATPPLQPTPPPSPWAERPPTGNPFTLDGTATVVDNAISADGKEFFTFTTPEGNEFFLIIDRSRPNNNVYFLNAVTEADLMALAETSTEPPPFAPVPEPLPLPPPSPEITDDPQEPDPPAPTGNDNGTIAFVAVAALIFGGAAYYLKIVRPKKQGAAFDEEYDEYEDEDEFDDEGEEEESEEIYDVEEIIREVRESEATEPEPSVRQAKPRQGLPKRANTAPINKSQAIVKEETEFHDDG